MITPDDLYALWDTLETCYGMDYHDLMATLIELETLYDPPIIVPDNISQTDLIPFCDIQGAAIVVD